MARGVVPSASSLSAVIESADRVPDGPANSGNSPRDIRDCYIERDRITIEGFYHPISGEFVPRLTHDEMGESTY